MILSNQSLRHRSRPSIFPAGQEQSVLCADPGLDTVSKSVPVTVVEENVLNNLDSTGKSPPTSENERSPSVAMLSVASGTLQSDESRKTPLMDQNDGDLAIEAAMSLESLAWGTTHLEHSRLIPSPSILTLIDELQSFIDREKAREIIQFHKTHVAWMHNVLYMPFFIRETEGYLNGRLQRDAAWLTLYCAVLCVSSILVFKYGFG